MSQTPKRTRRNTPTTTTPRHRAHTWGWRLVGAVCIGAGVMLWGTDPGTPRLRTPGTPGWPDPTITAVVGCVAVSGLVHLAWRARHDQRRRRVATLTARLTTDTQSSADDVRVRVRKWRRSVPVAGTARYGGMVDDSPGSAVRDRVEKMLAVKVGAATEVIWDPPANRLRWEPRRTGAGPKATKVETPQTAPGPHPARTRVEEAVRATVRGEVTFSWAADDATGPTAVTIGYPSGWPDDDPAARHGLVQRVTAKAPGRWRGTWNTERNQVTLDRRPPMPGLVPLPKAQPGATSWEIPVGVDEHGQETVWDLRQAPHMMVVGPTGTGKTVLIRSVVAGAVQRGFAVVAADPKRIELTGLRAWPGVQVVASDTGDMLAVVSLAADEMDSRYTRIEAGEVTEDDLQPLLVVIDEATEWILRANAHWRANKTGAGTEHPIVERFRSMARLGRSARVHLLVGIQRPDAKVFGGEARDNYGARAALGAMSQDGARMVFGRGDVGRDIPATAKGRSTFAVGDEVREVQTYLTPNPRVVGTVADQQHLQALMAGVVVPVVPSLTVDAVHTAAAALDGREQQRRPRRATVGKPRPPRLPVAWEPVHVSQVAEDDRVEIDYDGEMREVDVVAVDVIDADGEVLAVRMDLRDDAGVVTETVMDPGAAVRRRVAG